MEAIMKTPKSDELLQALLTLPTDLNAIKNLLKLGNFTSDEISRAGYDYAESCDYECFDYYDEHWDEICCSDSEVIPNILSSSMYEIFELLLKYGLNPNAFCEGDNILHSVASVYNEFISADTLALLIEHGGDPNVLVGGESLFTRLDLDVMFDAFEQGNRRVFDSVVHCWMVLLGYSSEEKIRRSIDVFAKRRLDCTLPDFKFEDLKNHRNYYYGVSNVSGRGEDWSLHIFDKRTRWEVARL